ncbi:alpha/beta hydrolase [Phyllobacterium sp. 21LDTY02-6]|uniref:alpha/beta hydrolase n=1 Tax=Phyllobacterium sp. 21LDTY02-6 TaxID=2944903 RepID=UPI0020205E93|nr:alpha/beta hydrolase [Phyllobacterium sp. 21LDTY02-6]MCO4315784.1 alpha/beta hydrolase [Phyllobacterium sp. 21LDTY02-6]
MGKHFNFALMAGLFLAVAAIGPASARGTDDCAVKSSPGKATIVTDDDVDPRPDTDNIQSADACAPKKIKTAPQPTGKAVPINVLATGGVSILNKAVKGEIIPQSEGALRDDLSFRYRIYRPQAANGDTMVLLHGSGQDETSLVSFASKIAPNAVLLAVRGRVVQDGSTRWYRRLTPVSFDQQDIRSEATAFAEFLRQATAKYRFDANRMTFLGYSNGANLINSVMMLYPGLVKQAVLLRSMPVLTGSVDADLAHARVLTVSGAADQLYAPYAPALEDMLRSHGARVEARSIKSDHGLGKDDVRVVSEWLSGATAQLRK